MYDTYEFSPEKPVSDDVLTMIYEGNGLFARVIDLPAEEALRRGFELEGKKHANIAKFYQEYLDQLEWEETAITAIKWARLFGGAVAVMLIDDGQLLENPLNWQRIRSIDGLRVYDRSRVETLENDLYVISSQYGKFCVHKSRCLFFRNSSRLPEKTTDPIYQEWGIPEYVRIHEALRDAELAHSYAVKMLDRAIQPVYEVSGLSSLLATEQGEQAILRRLEVIEAARGMLGCIVIDSENERYGFRTIPLHGVSIAVEAACNYLSVLTNIPQTILFGFPYNKRECGSNRLSGRGENIHGLEDPMYISQADKASGENWYNFVQRIQVKFLKSNLQ